MELGLKDFGNKILLVDYLGTEYKTSITGIKIINDQSKKKQIIDLLDIYEQKIKKEERETYLETSKSLGFTFTSLEPEEKLRRTIDAGIKNIWMVGPAGCGNMRY